MWPRDLIAFATITTTLTAGVARAASIGLDVGDYENLTEADEKSDHAGKIHMIYNYCFFFHL